MKNPVHFKPLSHALFSKYIAIGTKAYSQHYLHLWPQKNAQPYIASSFTNEVLKKEAQDKNTQLYLIYSTGIAVGIFKITLNKALDSYTAKDALYVDKIYLLNEYSGKGIGKKVLQFITLRAQEMHKKVLWLDTMQKGPAVNFYLKNGFEIHDKTQITLPTVIEEERLMWIMTKQIHTSL